MAVTRALVELVTAGLTLLPASRDAEGLGRRRLTALVASLPVPAMSVGCVAVLGAAFLFPARTGEALALLALLPEGVWWAAITLIGALFGLRVQRNEQAFLREATTPLPPPVAEADSSDDAALTLSLTGAALGPNPALDAWLAVNPDAPEITQS